jgi:hypothetical protein
MLLQRCVAERHGLPVPTPRVLVDAFFHEPTLWKASNQQTARVQRPLVVAVSKPGDEKRKIEVKWSQIMSKCSTMAIEYLKF